MLIKSSIKFSFVVLLSMMVLPVSAQNYGSPAVPVAPNATTTTPAATAPGNAVITDNPPKSSVTEIPVPAPIVHYTIQITDPTSEQTFQSVTDSIPVTVIVSPDLKPDDQIILIVDGVAGEPTNTTSINLPRLNRGSHTIQAKIIQKNGPGAESQIITIYQQRASAILRPASFEYQFPIRSAGFRPIQC